MVDESRPIDMLEAQIAAISDTLTNLAGLVEKLAGIQSDLMLADFQAYSDKLSEPFSAVSGATEKLQELVEEMKMERNRLRNEE